MFKKKYSIWWKAWSVGWEKIEGLDFYWRRSAKKKLGKLLVNWRSPAQVEYQVRNETGNKIFYYFIRKRVS